MAIDVTARVVIARPREEVAAFVVDPGNDLAWIRALTSSRKVTEGDVGVGTQVERVAKMMGRSMPYTTNIEALESGKHVAMRTVEGPFLMLVDYRFEDASAGSTAVSVRNRGGEGWMFRLFGWAIGRMVNGKVTGDLKQLKRVLES